MSTKTEKALAYHDKGFNCAQAVACAFAEDLGYDEKEVFALTEALGFGMGHMSVCGAVGAMSIVAGMKESDRNTDAPATKKISYKASKAMHKAFEEKNKSIICREIKGVDTGEILRSCDGCIEDAVEIVEKYLNGEL